MSTAAMLPAASGSDFFLKIKRYMGKKFIQIAIFLFGIQSMAQLWAEGAVDVSGILSSEASVPFWMQANTNYRYGNFSNLAPLVEGRLGWATSDSAEIAIGASTYYRDDVPDEFQARELYLEFSNKWLHAVLGSQVPSQPYQGLSTTRKNFLWSGNARPIPGLLLEAQNPLRITNGFAIDWGIGHYQLSDDRYVADAMIHYKRIALLFRFAERHQVKGQLQHMAQWGGTSPEFGPLPNDFEAFVDVFFASRGADASIPGEAVNALGNHLGTFLLDYTYTSAQSVWNFYHEHPFEDGSGFRWSNFPDGVWGLVYQPLQSSWLDTILYEYVDTSDQSGNDSGAGFDGYFGNNVYRSGWAHEGQVIGLPFIGYDRNLIVNDINSPVTNNRVRVHHLGVSGSVGAIQWLLKTSYNVNLGTYRQPFTPTQKNLYNYAQATYHTHSFGSFRLGVGADVQNIGAEVFGVQAGYRYSF
ncbi:capsule assembly Wzi family protein [Altibacter sp. HG106]|uniref:capsule assembly Wzi family protein n=1 Tax=Altibacter sp. HG106 TaxID=3023937 RepID=UPI0023503B29|nr:capsule assembly Wzi family protein [Altibacter sp. HG106]MDC7995350.1 capsule assembly Wzi family protein [Altibacter sp. HG106]